MSAAASIRLEGPASARVPAPSAWRGVALTALLLAAPAQAQDWPAEKCRRYAEAWGAARQHRGSAGLSRDFLAAHEALTATGCQDHRACPRSQAEIAMADIMTLLALNPGLSGTFLPFICRS